MKQGARILLVEDESAIAEFILVNLRFNGFEPLWVSDAEPAMAVINSDSLPDIILLDWMLPKMSGIDLVRDLRKSSQMARAKIPIIMLTARSTEIEKIRAFNLGVDDYLVKPFSVQELIVRIHAILRRTVGDVHSGKVYRLGTIELDEIKHQVMVANKVVKLLPMEFKLLLHFMSRLDMVQSRGALVEKVWRQGTEIDERTVDVHIKRLRETLGESGKLLETVRGVGYRLSSRRLE